MNNCPQCEARGRSVAPATFAAQVIEERWVASSEHDGWQLCPSETCEVVYFRDEHTVVVGQTREIPFHKSDDPRRLVCFCFEHTVADVTADVVENGKSAIREAIKAACKSGRDDCERRNPQGRCCLGNVGKVVKQATPRTVGAVTSDCCGPPDEEQPAESCCSKATSSDRS